MMYYECVLLGGINIRAQQQQKNKLKWCSYLLLFALASLVREIGLLSLDTTGTSGVHA